jgi:hypothetical protein
MRRLYFSWALRMAALVIAAESIDELSRAADAFEAIRLSLEDGMQDVDPQVSCYDAMQALKKAIRDFKWALADAAAAAVRRTDSTQPDFGAVLAASSIPPKLEGTDG